MCVRVKVVHFTRQQRDKISRPAEQKYEPTKVTKNCFLYILYKSKSFPTLAFAQLIVS